MIGQKGIIGDPCCLCEVISLISFGKMGNINALGGHHIENRRTTTERIKKNYDIDKLYEIRRRFGINRVGGYKGHLHRYGGGSCPTLYERPGKGWVTAEYAMLPRATQLRNQRDQPEVKSAGGRWKFSA